MSWINQGGFPTGGGSGGTSVVNTTINNFEGSEIVTYATFAAMQSAFPIVDTIGVISASSGDGYEGQAFYYNTSNPGWVSSEAPVTVNGIAGPVISLDASNIAPTASRLWFTPAEQSTLLTASTDAALLGSRVGAAETDIDALQASQSTQDGRLTATELATTTNTDDIAALTTNLGGRLTIAEAGIVALENSQSTESGRLNALEAGQTTQDNRLTAAEGVNSSQGVQITALQLSDATLASRVTAVETSDNAQGIQISAIDGRLLTAESDINALESGQAIQDVATSAVNARVTVTETDIDNLQTTQAGFQSTIDLLPGVYQARSEKNIPGGYVGLRPDGTIDPLQLPPSVQGVREISYEPTIAARDALAAFDARPEINAPWGVAQAGFAVSVADKGDGSAGFYVWNGTGFDDYSNSFTLTNSDEVPEGSVNLYYTNARVAAAPAVTANTGAIATINAGQTTQDGRILALETSQATQDGRLTDTETTTATNAGDIAAIEAEQITQNGRLTTAESDITTNTGAIAANAVDIAALEANDAIQDTAISERLISFNGRTAPAAIPTAGDYDNSQITNVAALATGATTAAALDNLKTEINGIDASIASIDDKVTNGGDAGTVTVGTNNASDLVLIQGGFERIRLTGVGTKFSGLTESVNATGLLAINPSDGSLYVKPEHKTIYVSDSDLPIATWVNATTISVGSGRAICKDATDPTLERLWRHPIGAAAITVTLPSVTPNQDVYLYLATNDAGDTPTAFMSTSIPPASTPVGSPFVRLIAAFKLNSSAQLVNFQMTKGGWIVRQFDSTPMIAGASWASTVIPGVPAGLPVEFYGVASSGLSASGGQYSIKLSGANPATFGILAPANNNGHWASNFEGDMGGFYISGGGIERFMETVANPNFVIENGSIWHIKNGSDYNSTDRRPTLQARKYRTITTFNGAY